MATLTNNINADNIVDRYTDYIVNWVNNNIRWGSNSGPSWPYTDPSGVARVYTIYPTSVFGGTTSGIPRSVSGSSLGGSGAIIRASTLVSALIGETNRYVRVRYTRVNLFVTGGGPGWNRPAGPIFLNGDPADPVWTAEGFAHLTATYDGTIPTTADIAASLGIAAGNTITTTNLENFFQRLQNALSATRGDPRQGNPLIFNEYVCHASCHSSCHGSRSRR